MGVKKLLPLRDQQLVNLRQQWFAGQQQMTTKEEFLPAAVEWFRSTRINDLQGWDEFPDTDVILGCTHFIESLVLKHGWAGLQVLPQEYAYYGLMGKHGTEPGMLTPGRPLIVSLPNWRWADLRPEWPEVLRECERKNIPIHIDFAWITAARDIEIDLAHPCIQSFAMSLSKYAMEWNRVGVRWSRQRGMDSVTVFNHFERTANMAQTSAGSYIIKNLPRDYGWDCYGSKHFEVCSELAIQPTKIFHVGMTASGPQGIASDLVNGIAFD
jgi:hypothetical protein